MKKEPIIRTVPEGMLFECLTCGAKMLIGLPVNVPDLAAAGAGFVKNHKHAGAPHVLETKIIGDLEWQLVPPDKEMTWEEAKAYAASLGDGWRLPTVPELVSLWDYDKGCCPAFPAARRRFWSSSPYDSDGAWYVNFDNGDVYYNNRSNTYGVRCVRDALKGEE